MKKEKTEEEQNQPKKVEWIGSSLKDMKKLPKPVRRAFGTALVAAQLGDKSPDAKPLNGFGGAGVLEVIEDYRTDTYRAVYTVKFAGVVYVLHVFQKKSKQGIRTSRGDTELVEKRLKEAEAHYRSR
ncbi:MAG TPA: type II toxin-antitoxin system RelE/ParE family toxin [Syntrophorhabdaceae bacterium]|jgi:phage-related protein